MRKNELNKYGITGVTEVLYNPTYEVLYNEETRPELEGFDRGQVTELGAINVMTGVYTGRSPKDKYIVMDAKSKDTIWWDTPEYPNDNRALSEENWKILKDIAVKQLSGKRLFVVDGFCGTHKETRMKIRFIMEVAWQAHFVTNMFIRPKNQEEFDQEPDFVVYCAAKAKVDNYKEMGLRTETAVAFNVSSKEQVIINTWYGGEMKKGIFSMMNYYLPLQGVASMHCSANTDLDGKNTAIFFGLSGTGKTTLSTDPKRLLIGKALNNEKVERMVNVVKEMEDSMTVNVAYHSDDPNAGLALTKNEEYFKMYASDTGLFVTLAFKDRDITENIIYDKLLNDKLSTNLGYVYENVIAQMLRTAGKNLFYHTIPYSEGKKYYEIDFVIPDKHKISPIEVKSSGYKTHRSLDEFCSKFPDRIMNKYLIYTKDYRRENGIEYIPVYMTMFL
jgi:hypothetical protein